MASRGIQAELLSLTHEALSIEPFQTTSLPSDPVTILCPDHACCGVEALGEASLRMFFV